MVDKDINARQVFYDIKCFYEGKPACVRVWVNSHWSLNYLVWEMDKQGNPGEQLASRNDCGTRQLADIFTE